MDVQVDGVSTPLLTGSLSVDNAIGQRSTGGLYLLDEAGVNHYDEGQRLDLFDNDNDLVYSGVLESADEDVIPTPTPGLRHKVTLKDWHYLADKRRAARSYVAGQTAGDLMSDLIGTYLAEEGVLGSRTAPIFARASIAYYLNGGTDPFASNVSTGIARYVAGAANMLSELQADIEGVAALSDPSFRTAGSTIARDTSEHVQGAASLRVITDGTSQFQEVSINLPASAFAALTTYTFSGSLKAQSGTPTLRFYCQANDQIAGNTSLGPVGNIVLSTSWQRFSFTVTMPADLSPYSIIGLRADTGAANQALTWYMDALQIETGAVMTPWVEGGQPARSALRIEEGTTNLLSANQSDVETNTVGFSAAASTLINAGATISRDTAHKWANTAALKIITTNAVSSEGAETTGVSAPANTKVAATVWLDGIAGQQWVLRLRDNTNGINADQLITLGSDWTKATVTLTTGGSAVTDLRMAVKTNAAVAQTVWADGWQIEQKPHATTWTPGGTPRSAETLKIPAHGLINPSQGTIQFRAYIDADVRRQPTPNNGGNLFGIDKGPTPGNGGALAIFHSNNTANWVVNIASTDFPAFSDSFTPDGWHKFAVAWDKASVLCYVDGVLRATQNNPHLATLFADFLYIGSNGVGSDHADTIYRDVRISSRKRGAAEIAADAAQASPLTLDAWTVYLAPLNGSLAISTPIDAGATLPDVVINYATVAEAFDALTRKSGAYWWQIDQWRAFHFRQYAAVAAPWALVADINGVVTDARFGSVRVKRAKPLYRNTQYVRGVTGETDPQIETRKGDGAATAFTFGYPIAHVPTVEVKIGAGAFVAKTVGIKGAETGKDFYWNAGDAVITQDTGGVVLTSADTLRVTYVGSYPLVVISLDSAEVANQQTLEGGDTSGKVEDVVEDTSLTTSDAAFTEASALLAKFAQKATTLRFQTMRKGLAPGQLLHVNIPAHGLNNVDMLVESVQIRDQNGAIIWYDVTALLGPVNTTWVQFFAGIARAAQAGNDTLSVGTSANLVIPVTFTASATPTASYTATVYACPLFPMTFPMTLC